MIRPRSLRVRSPLIRECMAEFIGTFVLLLFGCAAAAQVKTSQETKGQFLSVNMAFSVGVMSAMYLTKGISGAHLNPAVTLSFCVLGKVPWRKILPYSLCQVLGAYMASGLVYLVYYEAIMQFSGGVLTVYGPNETASIFATYPPEYLSVTRSFLDQVVGTGMLMLCILSLEEKRNTPAPTELIPPIVAVIVLGIAMSMSANCGGAINPARDLGPRLFTLTAGWGTEVFTCYNYWFWVPLVAPPLGGVLGSTMYLVFIEWHLPEPEPSENVQISSAASNGTRRPPEQKEAMLFGLGSMAQTITTRNTKGEYLSTSFAFGFATTFGVYISRGVSGAQLNPAVSFSMCVLGRHQWRKFPFYTLSQLLGSFLGAATIYALFYGRVFAYLCLDAIMHYGEGRLTVTGPTATASIFATYPADYLSIFNGFVDQVIGTATLLVCLLALSDQRNSAAPAQLEPLMSGMAVFAIDLSMGGNSGCALNPVRDLGPRLFTYIAGWGEEVFYAGNCWFWVPLVGPFVGSLVGACFYQLFIELHHTNLDLKPKGLCIGNKMATLETVELNINYRKPFPRDTQVDVENTDESEERANA
ncbi:aquaporin-10a [Aplochiton taeniatus]